MATLTIELKKENAVETDGVIDWTPALKAAALEIQMLNTLAAEGTAFPRPIECNPDAMIWVEEQADAMNEGQFIPAHWQGSVEGFLGAVNTPPTTDGMVTLTTNAYEWINVALLPAMPTTFNFILGTPKHAGMIA